MTASLTLQVHQPSIVILCESYKRSTIWPIFDHNFVDSNGQIDLLTCNVWFISTNTYIAQNSGRVYSRRACVAMPITQNLVETIFYTIWLFVWYFGSNSLKNRTKEHPLRFDLSPWPVWPGILGNMSILGYKSARPMKYIPGWEQHIWYVVLPRWNRTIKAAHYPAAVVVLTSCEIRSKV